MRAYGNAVALMLVAAAPAPPRTELLIRAVDEAGRPARLTRAGIYFDGWGGSDLTLLPHERSSVRVGLDRDAACALDGALCASFLTFSARLLLEAEGLAPISSNLFEWLPETPPGSGQVTIRLPRAAPIRISRGQRREITVVFRERRSRTLQLVDPSGAPLQGARVTVHDFF